MWRTSWVVALIVIIAVTTGVVWYSAAESSRQEAFLKSRWNDMHVVFTEDSLREGKMIHEEYEVWYNGKSHYRLNVNEGPDKGSFSIWDDEKFYRYDSKRNEMTIGVVEGDVSPYTHWAVSDNRLLETLDEIKSGKMEKREKRKVMGIEVVEYGNKHEISTTLDPSKRYVWDGAMYVNGHLFSKINFQKAEKHTFDRSLLLPNPPADAKIIEGSDEGK